MLQTPRKLLLSIALLSSTAFAQMTDLGGGLAGVSGIPLLSVQTLTGSQTQVWPHAKVEIVLTNAAQNASGSLVIGGAIVNLPLLGGILVPRLDLSVDATTDAMGTTSVQVDWPNTQSPLYCQYVVADPAALMGVSFSNTFEISGQSMASTSEAYLTELFNSADPAAADSAYDELVTRGYAGISALMTYIQAVSPLQTFAGSSPAPAWASNSADFVIDQNTGVITARLDSSLRRAMYAVDAILAGEPLPYRNSYLRSEVLPAPADEKAEDLLAASFYVAWWGLDSGTLQGLQSEPRPLEGTTLSWAGGESPIPGWFAQATYQCLPGTETPTKDKLSIHDITQGATPGGYKIMLLPPKNPGGPRPTNCLGSALGIEGWPQAPVGDPNMNLGGVMGGEGYTQTPNTSGQGQGETVVANVYVHKPNDPNPTDDINWKHSMKRVFEGGVWVWYSKDAYGNIYKMSDGEAFNFHLFHIGILKPGQNLSVQFFKK